MLKIIDRLTRLGFVSDVFLKPSRYHFSGGFKEDRQKLKQDVKNVEQDFQNKVASYGKKYAS